MVYLNNFQKTARVNNDPICENSPNLPACLHVCYELPSTYLNLAFKDRRIFVAGRNACGGVERERREELDQPDHQVRRRHDPEVDQVRHQLRPLRREEMGTPAQRESGWTGLCWAGSTFFCPSQICRKNAYIDDFI